MAEAAVRADDLVGHEQHAVAVADLAHAREVARRRRDAAARVLQRLDEHRGDGLGTLGDDRILDRVRARGRERVVVGGHVVGERGAVAVGVRDVRHTRHERLERIAQRGDPVIASAPSVVPW